jgi:hypothetical protein
MMEIVSTSETSVNFYDTTRRKIPEDSHLQSSFCLANTPCFSIKCVKGFWTGCHRLQKRTAWFFPILRAPDQVETISTQVEAVLMLQANLCGVVAALLRVWEVRP